MKKALKNGLLFGLQGAFPILLGILPASWYLAWQSGGGFLRSSDIGMMLIVIPSTMVFGLVFALVAPEHIDEGLRKGAIVRKWMFIAVSLVVLVTVYLQFGPGVYGAVKYALQPGKSVAEQRAAHPDDLVQVPGLEAGSMPMMLSYIPSGSFVTGEWLDRRRVILTHGFWMGKYEITNAQFEAFVNNTGYVTSAEKEGKAYGWNAEKKDCERIAGVCWRNAPFPWPLTGNPKDHPAVYVSWDDAKAFCAWLDATVGGTWDLPTDAQWEYACRAGLRTAFYWGNSLDEACTYENVATPEMYRSLTAMDHCSRDTPPFPCEDGFYATAPVGQFAPNAFGLHDMLGNVKEWCRDKHSYRGQPALFLAVDPQGSERVDSDDRLVRGGCWENDPKYCRADYSNDWSSDYGSDGLGFRVVRVE
jgi:sulfatase modifying factor 1